MRAGLVLVAILSAVAGAALAQTPAASTPAAPSPAASPAGAPAAQSPAPGATVSGLTVEGLPRRTCAPKDKDCIAIVMAELKELYPEQLKKFCYQQKMQAMAQDMQANMAGWCSGPAQGASALCNHYVAPVVKQVCTPDPPTMKK